jgi:hypothetical protein
MAFLRFCAFSLSYYPDPVQSHSLLCHGDRRQRAFSSRVWWGDSPLCLHHPSSWRVAGLSWTLTISTSSLISNITFLFQNPASSLLGLYFCAPL